MSGFRDPWPCLSDSGVKCNGNSVRMTGYLTRKTRVRDPRPPDTEIPPFRRHWFPLTLLEARNPEVGRPESKHII